jgi:hypothetical protein
MTDPFTENVTVWPEIPASVSVRDSVAVRVIALPTVVLAAGTEMAVGIAVTVTVPLPEDAE